LCKNKSKHLQLKNLLWLKERSQQCFSSNVTGEVLTDATEKNHLLTHLIISNALFWVRNEIIMSRLFPISQNHKKFRLSLDFSSYIWVEIYFWFSFKKKLILIRTKIEDLFKAINWQQFRKRTIQTYFLAFTFFECFIIVANDCFGQISNSI